MTATPELVTDLKRQVLLLEDDLRQRVESQPDVLARWKDEHARATRAERTASSWVEWRDDRVTQVAVAWVLTTVFIRFCEDNALISPVWIAGPPNRRQEALDAQNAYFRANPTHTDRDWLMRAIDHLASTPATSTLVEQHSMLWKISPSGRAATSLLAFWRNRSADGSLMHDLADPELSTRFLGDLYQDLSEFAKKTYALLQTPEFVEEFILDQTLEPALAERPLEGFRLIDPACGSGHFLLGAFRRLLVRWEKQAPALEPRSRIQEALDTINGVDLNPFAVAITRFRLVLASLQALGETSLERAPAFTYHVETGDSLLHWHDQLDLHYGDLDVAGFAYSTEDRTALAGILRPGRYDVVVANPPYITVKDKGLNKKYRSLYKSSKGKYALTVPFMERIFQLARPKRGDQPAGWTGQITSNSFMKREFGTDLVEGFLPGKDLFRVIDSEGAWIPGHNTDGTPTVILVARNQSPTSDTVRVVLGRDRRETRLLAPEGRGPLWASILEHVTDPGFENEWISVVDMDRRRLAAHPWSLAGGGADQLIAQIERKSSFRLRSRIGKRVGFASFPGSDDSFFTTQSELRRSSVPEEFSRKVITGDVVRDWQLREGGWAFAPYDAEANLIELDSDAPWARRLWPLRTTLNGITGFDGETQLDAGKEWWGWYRWVADRYRTPLSIVFAEVATHNHFVLERGGRVFKQTAPVIKLREGATENDHLKLLGLLNTSTVCFWLKQVCKPKGGAADIPWLRTYQFNGTNVENIPLVVVPPDAAQRLDELASQLGRRSPAGICEAGIPTEESLAQAEEESASLLAQMIAVQEELDWEAYRLYGIIEGDLTYHGDDLPQVGLGERAFEIALARGMAAGDETTAWFARHGSTPVTELPSHWPASYGELVNRRISAITSDRYLALLEKPECKRRWEVKAWDERRDAALRDWLLNRLEDRSYWFDRQGRPTPQSVGQLADRAARDTELTFVLSLWERRPDVPVLQSLVRLLADEAVPYLAAHRLKDSGLRIRKDWETAWALQRREDAGEKVGVIPVPKQYSNTDFRKVSYWQARGKLDVPKERFILYPEAGRSTDPTPLLGWAGWDHAQQALALSTVIGAREAEGASDDVLTPLVAGLAELQPWVEQWHSEIDPAYGVSLAVFCAEQLAVRARQVGQSLDQLHQWRPPTRARGRRARS